MTYSVVVPLYNEQDNVMPLYTRLTAVMENTESPFELIFVDDGSSDATFRLLSEISAVDQRIVVLRLRRNFGQTGALAAGFDHATGEYVIAMDGDLQDQPEDIPRLLEKLDEGYDIVSAWRRREENFLLRRLPSRCANWFISKLSGAYSRFWNDVQSLPPRTARPGSAVCAISPFYPSAGVVV